MKFSELKNQIKNETPHVLTSAEVTSRVENLKLILDVVKKINQTLVIDEVLDLVLRNAIKLTQSDRGFVVLIVSGGALEYRLGLDSEGNKLPANFFEVSTSVVEDVYKNGISKFIEGAMSDAGEDSSRSILKLELQTILCSPLISDDYKIGVIYVDSKQIHKIKISEITDTFEILAGQAATAIKNAQLYNAQISSYNALQEANQHIIQVEKKVLKSSIDAEIGQSLQGHVHLAMLENESLLRSIENIQTELLKGNNINPEELDRLLLKSKVSIDSIRSIQKFAQALLETSIMSVHKDSGDLNKTIQSIIKYLTPIKNFDKIIFKTELNTIPVCHYDSEQIQHLIVNLITNSVNAKIDCKIFIRTKQENDFILIEVEDDGPGIDSALQEILFDTPSEQKKGYGLFMCKNIVDLHNGNIEFINTKNGTLFKIKLPIY